MFAGVREKISKSGWIGPLAGATLLVVGLVAIVSEVSGGSSSIPGVSDKAFFTTNEDAVGDEALNALFVDDINKIPPFPYEGKTAYGAVVLHVAPEAANDGPIALVREGDRIRLDKSSRSLDLLVDEAELERRRAEWEPLPQNLDFGVAGKYAKLVGSAANGAVCG